jgi:hypothetical protein
MNRRGILRWLCALPFVPAALAKPRLTRLMTEPSVLETQPKLSAWDEDCYALDGYPDPAIRLAEEIAPGGMTTEWRKIDPPTVSYEDACKAAGICSHSRIRKTGARLDPMSSARACRDCGAVVNPPFV